MYFENMTVILRHFPKGYKIKTKPEYLHIHSNIPSIANMTAHQIRKLESHRTCNIL